MWRQPLDFLDGSSGNKPGLAAVRRLLSVAKHACLGRRSLGQGLSDRSGFLCCVGLTLVMPWLVKLEPQHFPAATTNPLHPLLQDPNQCNTAEQGTPSVLTRQMQGSLTRGEVFWPTWRLSDSAKDLLW